MNPHLAFLLTSVYDGPTRLDHPAHVADLGASGLTPATMAAQKFTDVPPHMIDRLLGFDVPAVQHAYLIPFPDARGGWLDHTRLKIFPSLTTPHGTIKYLQPRGSGVRLYFPLATMPRVLHGDGPLAICEGEKKAASVAQTGTPVVGLAGIDAWRRERRALTLHRDFDPIPLRGRAVDVIPDGDWRTTPAVNRAVHALVGALEQRGARVSVVLIPEVSQ
jgi:hypothetical protein